MFSLLTLLDDIATTFNNVAIMSKVAMKKTTALMSDDLAVNAGVVHGVNPKRELPIVKAIFIGSLLNKVYCILGVLLIMALYPPLLKVILFIGGVYLAYEGAHKIVDKIFNKHFEKEDHSGPVLNEKEKIKGAVRTDLILSVEIIVIAKSSVNGPLLNQIFALTLVGLAASIIIYGLVAILVKIDDVGLHLVEKGYRKSGMVLVNSMPFVMKSLGVIGTVAMLLVGGGIMNHLFHFPSFLPEFIQNLLIGIFLGLFVVGITTLFKKLRS